MTKRSRKKRMSKQVKSPTGVSRLAERAGSAHLSHVGKLEADRTVFVPKEICIAAPVESCFDIIASQLEQPPNWDPMIVSTQLVSKRRGQIGTMSQVTLNLGGRKLNSPAYDSTIRAWPGHKLGFY